jgi:hypothetical protein
VLIGDNPEPGEILTRGRSIRTTRGGAINLLTPGGGLTLANTAIGNPQSPPGIITESGGDIFTFANNDVNIGIGRIFTLRGGNQVIWSTKGDIAAGSSSKTVTSAPPTRVLIDPQSAAVQTDLAGLATGGGSVPSPPSRACRSVMWISSRRKERSMRGMRAFVSPAISNIAAAQVLNAGTSLWAAPARELPPRRPRRAFHRDECLHGCGCHRRNRFRPAIEHDNSRKRAVVAEIESW